MHEGYFYTHYHSKIPKDKSGDKRSARLRGHTLQETMRSVTNSCNISIGKFWYNVSLLQSDGTSCLLSFRKRNEFPGLLLATFSWIEGSKYMLT
jgi:hypothetical protein